MLPNKLPVPLVTLFFILDTDFLNIDGISIFVSFFFLFFLRIETAFNFLVLFLVAEILSRDDVNILLRF